MPLKFAIVGFRHAHIWSLVNLLKEREDVALVGACEEHDATRASIADQLDCPIFDSYERMLATLDCDVVGVGDYFGARGQIIIEALKHGKHALSDKPVCTRLEELDEIESLLARNHLQLGCQLDMRGVGLFRRLRRVVQAGEIGEVHAISFGGQHPLLYGTRPNWYFEEGKHGGTINDIAIHAFDYIPWLTGYQFQAVNAARTWNAGFPQEPGFPNAAQMMLTLENGCGVLGDVSYLLPDSASYSLPHYWRTTLWGDGGVAETSYTSEAVSLFQNGAPEPRLLPPDPTLPGRYLQSFLDEVNGQPQPGELTTADVLRASRWALLAQLLADATAPPTPA